MGRPSNSPSLGTAHGQATISGLIREWHGTTHRTTVAEKGFLFGGKRYRSLSEIARAITGTHWSGPRFFGLRARAKETNHGVR